MATFLEAMNEARERLGSDPLTYEAVNKKIAAARDLLAAGNKSWRAIKNMSVDLQFSDIIATTDTVIDDSEIQIEDLDDSTDSSNPGKVDTDIVKWIKAPREDGNGLYDLMLLTDERAAEELAKDHDTGRPRFYYINNEGLFLIPTPDAEYELTMKYQKEYRVIKASNVNDTFPGSQKWVSVFIDGVEAFLKKKFRHADAATSAAEFERNVQRTAALLNKWKKKKDGHKRISIVTRKRSRRAF